jgi:hypothetical protein
MLEARALLKKSVVVDIKGDVQAVQQLRARRPTCVRERYLHVL